MSILVKVTQKIIDVVFPHSCSNCGSLGTILCPDCYSQLKLAGPPIKLNLPEIYLDEVTVAGDYKNPLKSLITDMKYRGIKDIGYWLGEFLYESVHFEKPDLITCIPLHPKKQRLRGFNQAELIAKTLSYYLSVPFRQLLVKKSHTAAQASLNKEQRINKTEDLFALNQTSATLQMDLKSKHILLVDDVITTGTTINLAAKTIKQSYPNTSIKITGVAIAHGW